MVNKYDALVPVLKTALYLWRIAHISLQKAEDLFEEEDLTACCCRLYV